MGRVAGLQMSWPVCVCVGGEGRREGGFGGVTDIWGNFTFSQVDGSRKGCRAAGSRGQSVSEASGASFKCQHDAVACAQGGPGTSHSLVSQPCSLFM